MPPKVMTEKEVQRDRRDRRRRSGSAAPAAAATLVVRCDGAGQVSVADGQRGGTPGATGEEAAEDRELVAAPRARERPVARDRAHSDDHAPFR